MGKEKIGVALAGGGARGAYQIGVYKALLEAKIKVDGITGTSIGSFNAALIASDEFDKLEYFWLNDDISALLGFMENMDIDKEMFKDYIKEFSIPYLSIIKNKGLPIDRFKNRVVEVIDERKIRNSEMDYGLVTFKIKGAKPQYLFKEDIPKEKITDYIIASCYLPVFHQKKLDDDSFYLDGGFVDNEPINMLGSKGYNKIYVVELGNIGISRKVKYDVEIIRIKPSRSLGSMLNANKFKVKENIKLGYYDGIKIFKNLDGYKYIFKKREELFYNFISRKVSKKTLMRAEVYFLTSNKKELVIKSLEYILKREKKTYLNIYKPYKEIKRIKKIYNKKDMIAYRFIRELKIF